MDLFIFVVTEWIATCWSRWPIVLLSQRSGVRLFHKRSGRAVSVYGLNGLQVTQSFLDTRRFQSLAAFWFESSIKTFDCKRFPTAALIFLFAVVAFVDMQNETSVCSAQLYDLRMRANGIQCSSQSNQFVKWFGTQFVTNDRLIRKSWDSKYFFPFLNLLFHFVWPFYFIGEAVYNFQLSAITFIFFELQ